MVTKHCSLSHSVPCQLMNFCPWTNYDSSTILLRPLLDFPNPLPQLHNFCIQPLYTYLLSQHFDFDLSLFFLPYLTSSLSLFTPRPPPKNKTKHKFSLSLEFFLFMCTSVCQPFIWRYLWKPYMCFNPLELKLQAFVSHAMWNGFLWT